MTALTDALAVLNRGDRSDALTELRRTIYPDDTEIPVISTSPFADDGVLLIDGEYVEYAGKTEDAFMGAKRGRKREDGGTPARKHRGGTPVRASAIEQERAIVEAVAEVRRDVVAISGFDEAAVVGQLVYVRRWGAGGSGAGQLNAPRGLATPGDGTVYVVDQGNDRVLRFSDAGVHLETIGSAGTGLGQFGNPFDVAVAPDSTLYVTDQALNRVSQFDPDGRFVFSWPTADPGGIAVGHDGSVYVASAANDAIARFDSAGALLGTVGSPGTGDGQVDLPSGLAIDDDGLVYVADTNNHRIQVFTPQGAFVRKWGSLGSGDGQFDSPQRVAVDGDDVFVTDGSNRRLQWFDRLGTYKGQIGSNGSGPGQFGGVQGVCVVNGMIHVADQNLNRVQVFRLDDGRVQPVPIPVVFYRISTNNPGNNIWSNMPAAETGLFNYSISDFQYRVDLSLCRQARFNLVAALAASGAKLRLAYSNDGMATWATITDCPMETGGGSTTSGWVALPDGARTGNTFLRVTGLSGNGVADPYVYQVVAEFR